MHRYSEADCRSASHADLRLRTAPSRAPAPRGLSLVEMLVAMAITLLMMAAVATVFTNVSASVSRRQATIELSTQLRHVREVLQADLAGATCPAVPWQRPESNHGYLEIIEGPQNDAYPSVWLFDGTGDGAPDGMAAAGGDTPGIDMTVSSLPGSLRRFEETDYATGDTERPDEGPVGAIGSNFRDEAWRKANKTDGRGLGDADDVLMLTVRNETTPFVGAAPTFESYDPITGLEAVPFPGWGSQTIESTLAEVVWFAVENPPELDTAPTYYFGEPGYRTVYRRALLIAPWLDYGVKVAGESAGKGVVRVLRGSIPKNRADLAIASLIAFQDRFDLSVRIEWDPLLDGGAGRWKIVTNTLGDLTKRENRYEHHGYVFAGGLVGGERAFPFAVTSAGQYDASQAVTFLADPEFGLSTNDPGFVSLTAPRSLGIADLTLPRQVVGYEPDNYSANDADDRFTQSQYQYYYTHPTNSDRNRTVRPFVYLRNTTGAPATARAIVDEDGFVVRVVRGLAPLSGKRRGEDVMLTEATQFDLKAYDPGAPVYAVYGSGYSNSSPFSADAVIGPDAPLWAKAYLDDLTDTGLVGDSVLNSAATPSGSAPGSADRPWAYERSGEYVDLGYGSTFFDPDDSDSDESFTDHHNGANSQFVALPLPTQGGQPQEVAPVPVAPGVPRPRFFNSGEIRLPNYVVESATLPMRLAPGYSVYDTWSLHYENNGVNEDRDGFEPGPPEVFGLLTDLTNAIPLIDEGTNGLEDFGVYVNAVLGAKRFSADDPGERETQPPYDSALRGVQVSLGAYERDSRQIRAVKVVQTFVPE
ncbi:hypothetical protein Mal64_38860 [Pseudobythopirellula maris]|uniref:Prepilin-type N-terminal cleavage/methylation domain-containing protein n=1 Tax=Pseudobythopirellula maris TaxID=2527991 RepID=A0A5C5ZG06_9BACT|nr:prepilin-type N-terminal cleavage/methylation domain-containing protein [Pseudobythopirellula maris]TWT86146.1 hypothetical protein Mal64_38860 [Pseudobythopirellula maris]